MFDLIAELSPGSKAKDTSTVTVQFEEDQEIRRISRPKALKLRCIDDKDVDFDALQAGDPVMAYWSPMRTFYEATVLRVPKRK